MANRLNISVSDELYEKIDCYRNKLKISKVCQKALEKAVQVEEAKEEFRNIGFADGQKQAVQISSEDIEKILEIMKGKEGRYRRWNKMDRMEEVYERFADKNVERKSLGNIGGPSSLSYQGRIIDDEDDIAEIFYEYREAWVDGVMSKIDQDNSK
jgi:hypothetical protein